MALETSVKQKRLDSLRKVMELDFVLGLITSEWLGISQRTGGGHVVSSEELINPTASDESQRL